MPGRDDSLRHINGVESAEDSVGFRVFQDSLDRQVWDFLYDSPSVLIGQVILFVLLFVFLMAFLLLRALRTDLNDLMDAIRRQGKEIDRIDA